MNVYNIYDFILCYFNLILISFLPNQHRMNVININIYYLLILFKFNFDLLSPPRKPEWMY